MSDSMFSTLTPQYIAGLILNFPVKQFLSDTIYGDRITETMDFKFDVIRGAYPMAPVTGMNAPAPICNPPNIDTMAAAAMVIKHKIIVRAADMVLLRKPGTISDKYSQQLVLDYTTRVNDGVDFRVEWLKMTALTGKVAYADIETGVSFNLNFGYRTTHDLVLGTNPVGSIKWDDLTNSDPLSDILAWANLIERDGGAIADKVIMNKATLLTVLNNSKIRQLLQYTTTTDLVARIKTYLAAMNIELVISSGVYTDNNGVNQPLVGDGRVHVIASQGNSSSPTEKTAVWYNAPNEYTMNPGKYGDVIEVKDPKSSQILAGINGLPVVQFPDRVVTVLVF